MNELPAPKNHKDRIKLLVESGPENDDQAAAALGMSPAEAEAFISTHSAEIAAESHRALMSGKANITMARRVVAKLLTKLESGIDDLDVTEVGAAMKPALSILDAADRMRLAAREKANNLPVFHITIGRMHVAATPIIDATDVVDVTPTNGDGV